MAKSPIDGVGLAAASIGAILVYAGARGYSVLAVVQNLVTGKPITTDVEITNPLKTPNASTVDGTPSGYTTPPGGNQALGMTLASSMYGWEGQEWIALQKLWNRESSWNSKAMNPSSKAYGIPQALPWTKMPKAAWPESAGGKSDARTQIEWGLKYIKQRYGKPSNAWAHSERVGWY